MHEDFFKSLGLGLMFFFVLLGIGLAVALSNMEIRIITGPDLNGIAAETLPCEQ